MAGNNKHTSGKAYSFPSDDLDRLYHFAEDIEDFPVDYLMEEEVVRRRVGEIIDYSKNVNSLQYLESIQIQLLNLFENLNIHDVSEQAGKEFIFWNEKSYAVSQAILDFMVVIKKIDCYFKLFEATVWNLNKTIKKAIAKDGGRNVVLFKTVNISGEINTACSNLLDVIYCPETRGIASQISSKLFVLAKYLPYSREVGEIDDNATYREINIAERTITIGSEIMSIDAEKVWDLLKELWSNSKHGGIVFRKDGKENRKNEVDSFRKTVGGAENCRLFIQFGKDGYKLNPSVKIKYGLQYSHKKKERH